MRFMNEYDIQDALVRHARHPVKAKAARVLNELRMVVDGCSDGWAYWKAPVQAAKKLMELIEDMTDAQATDAAYKAAVRPVKAFLTRHKATVEKACLNVKFDT